MGAHVHNRRGKPRLATVKIASLARELLKALECPRAELSLQFVGDDEIAVLNEQWRGKARPTDVLSFSQLEDPRGRAKIFDVRGYQGPLGDIVISYDTAMRQANDAGASLEEEIARLMIHGVLHLMGHDHVHGGRQAARMKREEGRLMAVLAEQPS